MDKIENNSKYKPLTEEDKKAAFLRTVHNMSGSHVRWRQRAKTGLTDCELEEALRYEFGIAGGGSCGIDGLFLDYQRSGLKIWAAYYYSSVFKHTPIFQGAKTIEAARVYLGITDPNSSVHALTALHH